MKNRLATLALLSALASPAFATTSSGLPFIADDYGRARKEAIKRKLPLFVEVWAPW